MAKTKLSTQPKAEEPTIEPVLEHNRCGFINEFLWTCAGVNKKVLRQCPSDYAKYAGIGGTILFTALMAALSGGYALNFVFDNIYIACAFGIFWGLLIFNLDRFIVNTMYSDGKHTISWGEIKSGLPRIIMAIFLGIVISTPLELKIFYKEIEVQMSGNKKKQLEEYTHEDKKVLETLRKEKEQLQSKPIDVEIIGSGGAIDNKIRQLIDHKAQLNKDYQANKERISKLSAQFHNLNALHNHNDSIKAQAIKRLIGNLVQTNKGISGELSTISIELETNSAEYKKLMDESREQRKKELADLQRRITELEQKISNAEEEYGPILDKNFGGLRAQMKAFSDLRKEDKSTDIAAWFIMLLFVIVETAPTFFKMMMEDGPYDDLLRAEKHRVRVLSQKRISDVNDYVNTEIKISTMKNQKRLEAETIANKDALNRIATAQAELLQKSIEAWRQEELRKIEENPTGYIKISTKNNQKEDSQ